MQAVNCAVNPQPSCDLCTAIVPLKINFGNRILWENETPNSVKLCRPLKIKFIGETKEISVKEEQIITS